MMRQNLRLLLGSVAVVGAIAAGGIAAASSSTRPSPEADSGTSDGGWVEPTGELVTVFLHVDEAGKPVTMEVNRAEFMASRDSQAAKLAIEDPDHIYAFAADSSGHPVPAYRCPRLGGSLCESLRK